MQNDMSIGDVIILMIFCHFSRHTRAWFSKKQAKTLVLTGGLW